MDFRFYKYHTRNTMVDYGKLRDAQLLELELLKKFREICDAEGFRYYLLGGTAIGAIRHAGFIPWDDDIDVGLLREDYEQFLKVAPKYLCKEQRILHYTVDENYADYTMKLVNIKVSYLTQREETIVKQNIWIDIFPIDGTPNSRVARWLHFRKLDLIRLKLAFHYIKDVRIDKSRAIWKKALVWFAKKTSIGKLIDPIREKKNLDKEFRRYIVSRSNFIGNYMGAYHEKEFFPAEYFTEGYKVIFEGEEFLAPTALDKYLTHQYGDYMKLPPENSRIPKHHIIDIIREN